MERMFQSATEFNSDISR
ncbi:hypothetical protein JIY74_30330 [Vibrio harveyi]|nr:hypothetical protein [Vibrio harveyi]